jgi:2-desacetyl-2-hydroxyethyl bacteriochlorophyllide A dehydrogenase
MKAKAAVLKEFGQDLVIEEVPVPEPKEDEVLIRVGASGICATDLHIQEGKISTVKLPYTPGHEMAGEVWQIGKKVTNVKAGDRVCVHIDITCKACRFCRSGRPNLCQNLVRIGFERNGSHQEYVAVPAENVFKIGDSVSFPEAAIIPDAVSCMYHAIKTQAKVKAKDRVCILGVGGLGFHAIQIAKLFNAKVYVTSRKEEKLQLGRQFGADCTINTAAEDPVKKIIEITNGELCDVVFDNIGIETSIQQGLDLCRPGGKVIIVGYNDVYFKANYQDMMKNEKEIIGIRGSTAKEMVEVIKLVEEKKIRPFVYRTYPLGEINKALQDLKEGKTLGRSVLVM